MNSFIELIFKAKHNTRVWCVNVIDFYRIVSVTFFFKIQQLILGINFVVGIFLNTFHCKLFSILCLHLNFVGIKYINTTRAFYYQKNQII